MEDGRILRTLSQILTVKPPNDYIQNATVLVGTRIVIDATNEGCEGINPGSAYPRDPRYADNQGTHSLWYRWTAPREGRVRLRGEGLPGGVMVGAYSPGQAGSLVQETVNAFMPAGDPADFVAEAGKDYFIMVDGLLKGQGRLRWSLELMPSNDLFVNREGIPSSTETWIVPQVPSFLEAWEAPVVPPGASGSRWWIWRAPQSGWVNYRAVSTGSPVSVGAFLGQKLQLLEPMSPSGSLDTRSDARFFAEEGITYTLALFGSPPWTGEAKVELSYDSVRLLHPTASATLPWGSEITLEAAWDVEGDPAVSLEFFANSEKIGSCSAPPWTLPWRPNAPGSYTLQVVVQTASGTVFTSARVPTFVHSGGVVPAPRLFTSLESNGTGVMDGMGNVHLLGMPRGLFGITNAPIHGLPETASWPPGVARWTDLAVSMGGFGSPWMGALDSEGGLYTSPSARIPAASA